jgi:ribosomal protein S18 acetylase RimI-like enzyme
MNVLDGDEVVGTLWMGKPFGNLESTWFVFYVEIDEAHRGRGLGRAAMQAAEDWTKEHDGTRVALNVFGPNVVARSLYDSLGYQVMATAMFKDL